MQPTDYGPTMGKGRGQRGSLETLGDGRTRARYREDGRKGKRPQRTFEQREDAARWLRERLGEVELVQSGDTRSLTRERERATTVSEGIARFVATLDVLPQSRTVIEARLRVFEREFGSMPMASLAGMAAEVEAWRLTVKPGWRAKVFKDTRRMLRAWHRWGWIASNPAEGVPNPSGRAPEVKYLPWEFIEPLEAEIAKPLMHVPMLMAGTGLRPEEWLALEKSDLDVDAGLLHVRRVWTAGQLYELGRDGHKGHRQRRTVPLRAVVAERLAALPRRIDTRLLVPDPLGSGHLSQATFRRKYWETAFTAAGLPYFHPYAARHAYAAESIAAGVNLFDLSRFMGTSLKEIDSTYGHLVADSHDRGRELLDDYDRRLGRVAV